MALTHAKVVREANAIMTASGKMVDLLYQLTQVLDHNSDLAIDWGAASTPAYIDEDEDGNISGMAVSRQEVGNAIGSLGLVRDLLTNVELTWGNPGDHVGNLNVVTPPHNTR